MTTHSTIPVHNQSLGRAERCHAVRFYRDSDSLCELVADFLDAGLSQGHPAVIISTQDHRQGIVRRLKSRGLDVLRLEESGDLVLLDAHAMLDRFMVDGRPDAARFADTLIPVLERVSRGGRPPIRAYGEMVDVLWKAHQTVAATRLEMLWNDLARSHTFSLLCGYAMGNFYKDAAVDEICSHHTHVMSADGAAALAG